MSLATPLKVVNTIFSSYKSEEYARLISEKSEEIEKLLLSNTECNKKLADLVKQVQPEKLDKCPGADKLISSIIEINDYVYEIFEKGQKCYKEKQSITECYESYLSTLMDKSTTLIQELVKTVKSSNSKSKCFKQIYEQFEDVTKKLENECK